MNNGGIAQISESGAVAASLSIGSAAASGTVQLMTGGDLTVGTNGSGTITIGTQGTLQFSGGGPSGTVTVGNIVDNGRILFDGMLDHALSIGATGLGQLVMEGSGTLVITGANTYMGGTTIKSGTLALGPGGSLPVTGAVIDNGIFDISQSGANQAIGDLSGSGTVNLGSRELTAGTANSTTFTGTINDGGLGGGSGGSLIKQGTGTLTLTGANAYTGGTTISAGTLQLGNGGASGSIVGNVADGGVLAFDRSNALTFGGVISGTGSVQQIGTGTTTLTGNSTYTGGTTISAGTLALAGGGSLAGTGAVVDNATFDISQAANNQTIGDLSGSGTVNLGGRQLTAGTADSTTFTGTINDGGLGGGSGGSLVKQGAGTLILTGANTYTGGTTISAGTLQLGNGGTSGSIVGDVTDDGTLIFNRSDSLTFNGVISGTGDLQQNGSGTTILTAENTYTGATTVNAGSLIVNGSIASPLTTVNADGLLGGSGIIRGSVVNSGVISPGNPVGTLTVTGNYTQAASGTLRINVGSGAQSQLVVNGQANLGGGQLQLVPVGGFKLQVGQQVTFLTATGGVNGTFAELQNPFISNTIVKANVVTLSNTVLFEGEQGSFSDVVTTLAPTPNNAAVAHALDAAIGDPRAAALIAFLNSQPLNQLPHDLELIAPDEVTSAQSTGAAVGNVQTSNVGQRLETVRAGSTGFSSAGFALNGHAPAPGVGLAGVSGPEGKGGPSAMAPVPENRWGVFVTGLGEFTNVGSDYNAPGFDVRTAGVTLGADYRVTPNLIVGLTAGYAHTWIDLTENGSLDADAGIFGAYASLFGHGFYLDTAVMGGPTSYDSRRTALQGTARGSTDGTDFNVMVAGGYDWKFGALSVGPTARFQYSSTYVNGFTEHGSLAPLTLNDQHAESKRTDFGAKATYEWKVGGITLKPEVRASWQHEYGTTQYAVVSAFASGAGTPFSVTGPAVGHDSLLIGAGTAVLWSDRVATYIYYDGEVGRADYEAHAVSAGVRVTF